MTRMTNTTIRTRTLALFAGLAVGVTPALAQESRDYEWEEGEGITREEWYDPTDWFDDDVEMNDRITIDYEFYEAAYDAYFDGYYDAFEDDDFGSEYWNDYREEGLGTPYTEGYYDGYYDARSGYAFAPAYYVFTTYAPAPLDESSASRYGADRSQDTTRRRGDRAKSDSDASAKHKREASEQAGSEDRVRGTLERVQRVKDAESDHTVVRVRFEERDAMLVDLGPKMSFSDIPVASGDRVTFVGDKAKRDGASVLVVERISRDGESWTLREDKGSSDS